MSELSFSRNPMGYIGFFLTSVFVILFIDPIEGFIMNALFDSVFSITDILAGQIPVDSGFSNPIWIVPFLKWGCLFLYNLAEVVGLYGIIVKLYQGLSC